MVEDKYILNSKAGYIQLVKANIPPGTTISGQRLISDSVVMKAIKDSTAWLERNSKYLQTDEQVRNWVKAYREDLEERLGLDNYEEMK